MNKTLSVKLNTATTTEPTGKIGLKLSKTATGYEILTIDAGMGNGRNYPAPVIERAAPLWQNVPCYVDHEGTQDKAKHSAKDLGGYIINPVWDATEQGVRATLMLKGPAQADLQLLADAVLENPALPIGFSADIDIKVSGQDVTAITKVRSTDAVLNPARGGRFLRALLSKQGASMKKVIVRRAGVVMEIDESEILPTDEVVTTLTTQPPPATSERLTQDQERIRTLLGETDRQNALTEIERQSKATLAATCGFLLTSGLQASRLPEVVTSRLRKQFEGTVFEAATLQTAIEDARKEVTALTAHLTVQGPGRITGMVNADDAVRAAVDDMFGNARDAGMEKIQAARLSGIRDLYMMLTADYDLHQSVDIQHATLQLTTTNFTVLVKNALNKALVRHWTQFGNAGYNWWEQITTVVPFTSLNDITWAIFGTLGSLPTVLEGGEYTPLKIGDGGETSAFVKRGGYVGLTLEAIDRDNLNALIQLPRELAFAGIREISAAIAALFTANSAAGPTLADTGALFNSTVQTTKGGHKNLLTTALGTDFTAWEAAASQMYNQPMLVANEAGYYGGGKVMAIDPKFVLVPRALRGQANDLFIKRVSPAAFPVNTGVSWYGEVTPITVPDWTDTNDWAQVADPALLPGVMMGTRFGVKPEIFIAGNESDPSVFMNDESRIKVRHFSAIGVADFRPLGKNNV